jgi:hypothetical protein
LGCCNPCFFLFKTTTAPPSTCGVPFKLPKDRSIEQRKWLSVAEAAQVLFQQDGRTHATGTPSLSRELSYLFSSISLPKGTKSATLACFFML